MEEDVRRRVRKAYQLWAQNPFHPSLHFKCINPDEDIWSVRKRWDIVRWGFGKGIQ
jgi:hypothetical protein